MYERTKDKKYVRPYWRSKISWVCTHLTSRRRLGSHLTSRLLYILFPLPGRLSSFWCLHSLFSYHLQVFTHTSLSQWGLSWLPYINVTFPQNLSFPFFALFCPQQWTNLLFNLFYCFQPQKQCELHEAKSSKYLWR